MVQMIKIPMTSHHYVNVRKTGEVGGGGRWEGTATIGGKRKDGSTLDENLEGVKMTKDFLRR